MFDEKSMFKMVNENSNYYNIAIYIINNFNADIDIQLAKKMAEILVKSKGFNKDEIINGLADDAIINMLKFRKSQTKSVKQVNDKDIKVPLKTKKQRVNTKFVAGALATLIALSSVYGYVIKPQIEENKENEKIDEEIAMMASEQGSDAYIHKQSIVAQNTYQIPGELDNEGYPIVAYYNDKIAEDIVNVCVKDPKLFDICIYNVYFDMNHNRLDNMDSVINYLKSYSQEDPSLSFINEKLENCDVFLDYLVKRGFNDPNSKDYYKLLEDINLYETSSFTELPKESQERIENLIEEFKANKDNLYIEYKTNLEIVEGDDFGTRS